MTSVGPFFDMTWPYNVDKADFQQLSNFARTDQEQTQLHRCKGIVELRSEARRRWTDQIDRSLELHDYARAIELVRYAQNEFPGDVDLARLEAPREKVSSGPPRRSGCSRGHARS